MFGCGTPVLAKNYPAIDELVLPATNGDLFETADQLSQQIQNWFEVNTFSFVIEGRAFLEYAMLCHLKTFICVLDIILLFYYVNY